MRWFEYVVRRQKGEAIRRVQWRQPVSHRRTIMRKTEGEGAEQRGRYDEGVGINKGGKCRRQTGVKTVHQDKSLLKKRENDGKEIRRYSSIGMALAFDEVLRLGTLSGLRSRLWSGHEEVWVNGWQTPIVVCYIVKRRICLPIGPVLIVSRVCL